VTEKIHSKRQRANSYDTTTKPSNAGTPSDSPGVPSSASNQVQETNSSEFQEQAEIEHQDTDSAPLRRSSRASKKPARFQDYVTT